MHRLAFAAEALVLVSLFLLSRSKPGLCIRLQLGRRIPDHMDLQICRVTVLTEPAKSRKYNS